MFGGSNQCICAEHYEEVDDEDIEDTILREQLDVVTKLKDNTATGIHTS